MMQEVLDGLSLDVTAGKIEQLKVLFPEVFTEGKIDFKRLRDVLGDTVNFANEHYELSWAGKAEARKEVQKQTTATLLPDRESSIDFDNTENMFIEGENLEVLRVLQKSYFGKIKMIYIDPPYNTGNDSFVYPDDYTERQDEYNRRTGITNEEGFLNKQDLWKKNSKENGRFHSVWLSMMYPRLYLARNLLREDGVIFVSIDDNEQANLKLLMDEVFGEENFIGEFVWQSKKGGGSDNTGVVTDHEYILCFSKNCNYSPLSKITIEGEELDRTDELGEYRRGRELNKWGSNSRREDRPTMFFPIKGPNDEDVFPIRNDGTEGCWRWGKTKMEKLVADRNAEFVKREGGSYIVYEKVRSSDPRFKPYRTWLKDVDTTADGSKVVRDLFDGKKVFSFPKPIYLLKELLRIGLVNEGEMVLDFFAGSSSIAQAVLELNKEDNGNRKFILVQLPETVEENSEAFKAGYKTIADISKARIKKVIQKLKQEKEGQIDFKENSQPLGFQSYKLAPSNFEIWRNDIQGKEAILQQLEMFANSTKPGTNKEAMLTELLLKAGKPLTTKVQTQKTSEDHFYLLPEYNVCICLQSFGTDTRNKIYELQPKEVIILNSLFESDEFLSNTKLEFTEAGINLTLI